jgi:hypothetical protein
VLWDWSGISSLLASECTGCKWCTTIPFSPDIRLQGYFEELCAKRLGTGCEITCIDCDFSIEDTVRLAIGTRDMLVQVWELDPEEKMRSVFSVRLDVTVPKAVAFADNRAKDVYVFGLYDGNMYVCSGLTTFLGLMSGDVGTC